MAIPQYDKNDLYTVISLLSKKKNFITEDKKGIGIYTKLLNSQCRKNQKDELAVFSSDGKSEMIKLFKKLKLKGQERKAVYLVDLDFDDILKKEKILDKNFFYLEKYTLENYFVNEEVGKEIISFYKSLDLETAKDILKYEKWKESIEDGYRKIISLFLVVKKMDIKTKVKTCKISPMVFFKINEACDEKCIKKCLIENKKYKPCSFKVDEYKKRIKKDLGNISELNFEMELKQIEKSEEIKKLKLDLIPGKHLLNLYSLYINTVSKEKISDFNILLLSGVSNSRELENKIKDILNVIYE